MKFLRSLHWSLLTLVVIGAVAQQLASAQAPGTIRNGPFVWDGARWLPVEGTPQPPARGAVYDDETPGAVAAEMTVDDAPPPLPVYVQPPCPAPNLIWTPGYWHHGFLGFYWVPGAWVPAPYSGALWTPGYWGYAGGHFGFHAGYWGPHIGYYGGVNYGGGYGGIGFAGGTWNGGTFAYNTAVVRVNPEVVRNVYVNRTIVEQTTIVNERNVSYNGGPNGIQHQPAPEEQVAMHEQHTAPTTFQLQHRAAAAADKSSFASNNGGHPTNLAVAKPLAAEPHAAPAGFKPPPPRPVTELAKAQAPPETVAAAKTATTKTATVAKAPPPTPSKPAAMPAASPATRPAGVPANVTAPMPPTKPAGIPNGGTPLPSTAKPEGAPPAKAATPPPARVAEPEHAPAAAPKIAAPPPPKPATPKPTPKTPTKPVEKGKPKPQ
jgi:hypothetical protein